MSLETNLEFDPYRKWLGISKQHRRPNHYQLLRLADGESERKASEEAAPLQSKRVRAHKAGPHGDACPKLLEEIFNARLTLLDPTDSTLFVGGATVLASSTKSGSNR